MLVFSRESFPCLFSVWHNIESYRENGLRVPAREGDTSRKEPYEVRKSRGSKPQACSRPQEENVAACESPQCVARSSPPCFWFWGRCSRLCRLRRKSTKASTFRAACRLCSLRKALRAMPFPAKTWRSRAPSLRAALTRSARARHRFLCRATTKFSCRFPAFPTPRLRSIPSAVPASSSSPASIVSPTKR